ncbi:MAG TPA: GTP cyclohydrolase II [Candidatus Thermoplasmatota archaeon]|nr:GTP cyclohydrolase II [Candidatus Thermoplasmatota archaeon]
MRGLGFVATPPADLPTRSGSFSLVAFRFEDGEEHVAVVKGDPAGPATLARVHSSCLTGDVLGSCRCDCGPQLSAALEAIEREGRGVVLYLHQEGRGIGLFNKVRAYVEQDAGANTVEANVKLGFDADARSYEKAVAMLRHLGVESVRLLTNNPKKMAALEAAGIAVVKRVPHVVGGNEVNRLYIQTKRDLMGHIIT